MLKRDIQKAGVAPTDDTFTVIAPGPVDTGTYNTQQADGGGKTVLQK